MYCFEVMGYQYNYVYCFKQKKKTECIKSRDFNSYNLKAHRQFVQ